MEQKINEELALIKQHEAEIKPGESVLLPADTYEVHVNYLLRMIEEQKRSSDHWELEYYRLLNQKEGNDK